MITFEDLEGKQVTEEWCFGLNKGDIAEMSLGTELAEKLRFISNASKSGEVDAQTVIPAFKEVLAMSVGKRVNNRFMRSPEISAEFMNSEAYSELMFNLLSNAEEAADFANNLLPKDLARQIEDIQLPEDKKPSHSDLMRMSEEEFYNAVGSDPRGWDKDVMAIAMQRKNRQPA
jgi:hypothetical protein